MCAKSHTLYHIARYGFSKTGVFSKKTGHFDCDTAENRPRIGKIQACKQINSPCADAMKIACNQAAQKLHSVSTDNFKMPLL
jgi:hypothetical protein